MNLNTALKERRQIIIEAWTEAVFATFPFGVEGFIRTSADKFGNPVGYATRQAAEALYDGLSQDDVEMTTIIDALALFAKVRAVQEIDIITATGVVYLFKPLLREYILPISINQNLFKEYLELESKIDTLSLIIFKEYVLSCIQIEKEKVKAMERSVSQLKRLYNA